MTNLFSENYSSLLKTVLMMLFINGFLPIIALGDLNAQQVETLIIKDITLIDGTGSRPQPHASIFINDGRINQISLNSGSQISTQAHVIEGRGRYAIPGLFDVHAHVTFLRRPQQLSGYDRKTTERVLRIMLAYGITTARNPGAPTADGVALRNDIEAKRIIGPTMFTAGRIINWGNDKSEGDFRTEVQRQAILGVDYIKVYSRITPNMLSVVLDEAHKHGLKVIGHLGTTTPTEAVRLGIDGIEHGATWSVQLLPSNKRTAYLQLRKSRGYMLSRLDWLEWINLDGPEINVPKPGSEKRSLSYASCMLLTMLAAETTKARCWTAKNITRCRISSSVTQIEPFSATQN